jgi:hypothetical protein
MDGRGRTSNNIFVERLWRSVKYEEIYLKEYATVAALLSGFTSYFEYYNTERPHQALGYRTPDQVTPRVREAAPGWWTNSPSRWGPLPPQLQGRMTSLENRDSSRSAVGQRP